jgi:hypothetical protein
VGHALTLRGQAAAILWGYRPAASLTGWTVARVDQEWTVTATVARSSPFELRQVPLLLSVPHAKGFWVFPVLGPPTIVGQQLTARVGPPEQ